MDRYNSNFSKIYRINTVFDTKLNGQAIYATSPLLVKEYMDNQIEESSVSLVPIVGVIPTMMDSDINISGYFSEGDYFSFFQVPEVEGNWQALSSDPHSIAISSDLSTKLFGKSNPIGETVEFENIGIFSVVALFNQNSQNSHIKTDFLISQLAISGLILQGKLDSSIVKENNHTAGYYYTQTKDDISTEFLNNSLINIAKSIEKNSKNGTEYNTLGFSAQPLSDISPSRNVFLENGRSISRDEVLVLVTFLFILIFLCTFNYSGIMIAVGLSRSKEIGIRMTFGASKFSVFFRFAAESLTIVIISFFLGLILVPIISAIEPINSFLVGIKVNMGVLFALFVFVIFVGVGAGIIPAMAVSNMRVVEMFENIFKRPVMTGVSIRKSLILIQFSLSAACIIFAIVIYDQTAFMAESNYGYSYKDIVSIKTKNALERSMLRDLAEKHHQVLSISEISDNFGYMPTEEYRGWLQNPSDKKSLSCYYVNQKLATDLGLKIIEGSDFTSIQSYKSNRVLVNRRFTEAFGFSIPKEAIGEVFYLNDSTVCRIHGILEDFHFQNFKRSISPLVLRLDLERTAIVNLKVLPGSAEFISTLLANDAVLREKFSRSVVPFMWADIYRELQQHSGSVNLVIFLCSCLLLISSIGLLGMIGYSTSSRKYEVTMRKVLGAGVIQIISSLSKEYIILIFCAIVIGSAFGFFMSSQFLFEFKYRVKLSYLLAFYPFTIISIFCIIIIVSVTIRSAISPPIDHLRQIR